MVTETRAEQKTTGGGPAMRNQNYSQLLAKLLLTQSYVSNGSNILFSNTHKIVPMQLVKDLLIWHR